MEQTFNDLLRARAGENRALLPTALWLFSETFVGIIREHNMMAILTKKDLMGIALVTAGLLMVPFLAMQFSEQVNWGPGDFAVAAVLLAGAGLAYRLVARTKGPNTYRFAAAVAIAATLLLIWMNLAVGLIGSENHPANLMYLGVIAVAITGAGIARFEAQGMARALFATAMAHTMVLVIALMTGLAEITGNSVSAMVNINGFFILLFLVSALLFRHTARA